MKILRCFIDEDCVDFDEAAEWAVEKRKFLMMTKKPKKRSKPQCHTLNQLLDSYKRVRLERFNRYL